MIWPTTMQDLISRTGWVFCKLPHLKILAKNLGFAETCAGENHIVAKFPICAQ